jgi:hypothetical protein
MSPPAKNAADEVASIILGIGRCGKRSGLICGQLRLFGTDIRDPGKTFFLA